MGSQLSVAAAISNSRPMLGRATFTAEPMKGVTKLLTAARTITARGFSGEEFFTVRTLGPARQECKSRGTQRWMPLTPDSSRSYRDSSRPSPTKGRGVPGAAKVR